MACSHHRSQGYFPYGWLRQRSLAWLGVMLMVVVCWWFTIGTPVALAGLQDDRFDGNIFALYAGNGSLVPPRVSLASALQKHTPTLLVLYVEDSSDCKQYASVISQIQSFYGRVVEFIPINADAIPPKPTYEPSEPGYYYNGLVPQTVIFDQSGAIVLNQSGQLSFEAIDDVLRQVFDLLPRSESVELRRRQVNEINVELTKPDGSLPN